MSNLGVTSGHLAIYRDGSGYEVQKYGYNIAYFNVSPAGDDPFANARAFAEAPAMIEVMQKLVAGETVDVGEIREILARIENF